MLPGPAPLLPGATWLWDGIILLLTVALAALRITEPANVFLLLTTAVTVALVFAGTGASVLWSRSVLRRLARPQTLLRPAGARQLAFLMGASCRA
jgi:hypothetical protein